MPFSSTPRKPFPTLSAIHTVVFDFDGVFTNNKVWTDQDGRESVCCDRRDGLAIDLVRTFQRQGRLTAELFILSKETNSVVLARAKKLKLDCRQSVGDKLDFMTKHLNAKLPAHNDPFSGVVYLGNDLNDLPLMCRVGYAVAPADAHARVQEVAHLVLEQMGGDGFVRAFIERLLDINQLSEEKINELVSNC